MTRKALVLPGDERLEHAEVGPTGLVHVSQGLYRHLESVGRTHALTTAGRVCRRHWVCRGCGWHREGHRETNEHARCCPFATERFGEFQAVRDISEGSEISGHSSVVDDCDTVMDSQPAASCADDDDLWDAADGLMRHEHDAQADAQALAAPVQVSRRVWITRDRMLAGVCPRRGHAW